MVEVPKELVEQIYKLIESVKVDGKLRKGTNEATKSIEKSEAHLVISAEDVSPKEVVMHLPILCESKNIPFVNVPSKSELGAAAGLPIATSAIAIVNPGDAKKHLMTVIKSLENLKKAAETGKKEEKKEAPVENKAELKQEEKKPVEAKKVEEKPKAAEKVEATPKEEKSEGKKE
jgi:large subunit ribosomal protein L7Ae